MRQRFSLAQPPRLERLLARRKVGLPRECYGPEHWHEVLLMVVVDDFDWGRRVRLPLPDVRGLRLQDWRPTAVGQSPPVYRIRLPYW